MLWILRFCGLIFGTARRSQKWDRESAFLLFFYLAVHAVLRPCLSSFFEVFRIRVAEAQSFGFNETLWLMATGRATREALLSEAGFEKVFRTQNSSEQAVL